MPEPVGLTDLTAAADRLRTAEAELRSLVRRAAANGIPDAVIARAIGVHRLTVARWRAAVSG